MSKQLEISIDNLDDANDNAFALGEISPDLYHQVRKIVKQARADYYAERASQTCKGA